MLRITVEIEHPLTKSRRTLASGIIGNEAGGELSDYVVVLNDAIGAYNDQKSGAIKQYPRFAASVWDLVARAIVVALHGNESLPERPLTVSSRVPVHKTASGLTYVRLAEIPYPARAVFEEKLLGSARPVIEGELSNIAYSWDLTAFLGGGR